MKKKTKKNVLRVVLITVFVFIGVITLVLFFSYLFNSFLKPHFKIYEEECVDNYETLTDTITYTIIRHKEEGWGDYWKAYRIFEDKHKDTNFSSIWPIRGDIVNEERVCKKIPILGTNDYGTNCDYFNTTISYSFSGEFYNGSQSCELGKVDEIFLGKCKEGFEQADEPSGLSKDILMCYQEICDYIEEINWSFCSSVYDFIVIQRISKQDLTIEWLDENCECNGEWISTRKGTFCSKYSCGEYIVEVEK